MNGPLLILHIIICLILIFIVLFQKGKKADEGFLSGDSSRSQYPRGKSPLIVKFTTVVAVAFLVSSFFMTFEITKEANSSVVEKVKFQYPQESEDASSSK